MIFFKIVPSELIFNKEMRLKLFSPFFFRNPLPLDIFPIFGTLGLLVWGP